jgi:hypothetical protein
MHATLKILAILCLAAGAADAVPTSAPAKKPQQRQTEMYRNGKLPPPAPADFRVSVTSDRAEYVLGENVLVHFRIENTGKNPFTIEHGGDYRGAPRHTRFIVTATPTDAVATGGKDAPDPYPVIHHFGGLGGEQVLKPGERFEQSLPLMHYVHIPAAPAGEYVIRVSHDLGWQASVNGIGATAETRIRFTMPDDAAAKQVVEQMQALPPRNAAFGKREPEYADLSVLRYAIYLPMLEQRLSYDTGVDERRRAGRQALSAIERMPEPAAVKTLLRLADGKTGPAAGRIAQALSHHLPGAASDKAWAPAERFPADFSWRGQFAGDVRKLAARLLEMDGSPENVAWGGALLKHVGRADDLAVVVAALDRIIPTLATTPYNDGIFSKPRNTMASLQAAVRDLITRGAKPTADPKTPGEIVAYLTTFPADAPAAAAAAAAGLGERVAGWSSHPVAYVRELSLNVAPLPLPDALRDRLPALVEDDDVNVRVAASRLAQRAKEKSCGAAVLRRVKAAQTTWELDQQSTVTADLGIEVDAWHVMADRLDEGDKKRFFLFLRHLCGVAKHSGGFGWHDDGATPAEMTRVQARWQAFLKEHDAELRAGKRFKPGDGRFTADLFPPQFNLSTPQGEWPPRAK